MNYVLASAICAISLVVSILSLFENELLTKTRKNTFILLASLIIFEIFLDTLSFAMNGIAIGLEGVYRGIKVLELTLTPFIPAIMAQIVVKDGSKKESNKIRKSFLVLISINTITQIITLFVPFIFNINSDAIYIRTPYTVIYASIIVTCFVLFIITATKWLIQSSTIVSITLISTNLLLLLGMILRWIDIDSNADWMCITIGYFLFLIYYNDNYLKMDSTTSLLNRRAFDSRLSKIDYNTALILIDVNDFKSINDNYGHQSGDYALAKVSECILETFNKVGYCYRIGGDEFCVVLRPKVLKKMVYQDKHFNASAEIMKYVRHLDQLLANLSVKYPMFASGVSQGYGIYYVPNRLPTGVQYRTIEEVLKVADDWMYRKKEENKEKKT